MNPPTADMGGDGSGADLKPELPRWRWESPTPQGNNLRSIYAYADGADDALVMVGDQATVLRRQRGGFLVDDGSAADGRSLLGVAGNGEGPGRRVLSVGVYGLVLSGTGDGTWSSDSVDSGSDTLTALWASATAGEFYAVGTNGKIYRVRGGSLWERQAQGLVTQYLGGVWGSGVGAAQEVYAVGASGRVVHKKDDKWAVEGEGVTVQQLNAVHGAAGVADAIYAVGDQGTVLRRSGGAWRQEPTPVNATLRGLWVTPKGDEVYAVGNRGTLLRRGEDAQWRQESPDLTSELLSGVTGVVRGDKVVLYAVGNLGTVLRREAGPQGQWAPLSARAASVPLSSVWARGSDEVYAVGAGGLILRRQGPKAGGAWTPEGKGATTETLNAVSGHAPSGVVYAVGQSGTLLRRESDGRWSPEGALLTPQEFLSVWVGRDEVYAVARAGRVARRSAGRWALERINDGGGLVDADLLGVWGTGEGDQQVVYAVGASGVIARRDRNGWAREDKRVTSETLAAVWGASAGEVYAAGAKGVVLRRQADGWAVDPVQTRLSGRAVSGGCAVPQSAYHYLVASGGLLLRRQPDGAWTSEGMALTNQELASVSAAGVDDVYAVGSGGIILHRF